MAHHNVNNKSPHWDELRRSRHSDNREYLAALGAVPCIPVGVPRSAMRGKRGRRDIRPKTRREAGSKHGICEERWFADCDNLVRTGGSSAVASQISSFQTGQTSVEGGIPMQELPGTIGFPPSGAVACNNASHHYWHYRLGGRQQRCSDA